MVMNEEQRPLDILPDDRLGSVCHALASRGFTSATAYADARPVMPLSELAHELGLGITAIPFERKLIAEAEAAGTIEHCARSLLARGLRSALPNGWPRQRTERAEEMGGARNRLASVFVSLSMSLPQRYAPTVERIRRLMDTADIPAGWLPAGADDLVLVEACGHWGEDMSAEA